MKRINAELLKDVISSRNLINLEKTIQKSAEKYNLKQIQLLKLTPQKIYDMALILNHKKNQFTPVQARDASKEAYWMRQERKMFSWIIIYYCHRRLVDVSQLSEKQLSEIQNIFQCKQPMFLRYEIRLIFYIEFQTKPIWTEQQNMLLSQINQDFQEDTNWKRQSFQLFMRSKGLFYKLPEACRDRWQNHLNPKVNKAQWTLEQDLRIFHLINKHGMKWAIVSEKIGGTRTQHMIKNRVNKIVKKIKAGTRIFETDRIIEKALKMITIKINNKNRYQKTSLNKSTANDEQKSIEQTANPKESQEYEKNITQLKIEQQQDSLMLEDLHLCPQIASLQTPIASDYKSIDEILRFNNILGGDTDPQSYFQSFNQQQIESVQQSISIFNDRLF